MRDFRRAGLLAAGASGLLLCFCLPRHDLDSASQGYSSAAGVSAQAGGGAGREEPDAGGTSGANGGGGTSANAAQGGNRSSGDAGEASGGDVSSLGGSMAAGAPGSGAAGSPTVTGSLNPLPSSLEDSPVTGDLIVSADATWPVNKMMQSAFQVVTPTGIYFLVKKLGMIVSMVDNFDGAGKDWIGYSDAYRPNRGLPNLGGCCQAAASAVLETTLDEHSVGHARLFSKSASEDWSMVWDFYRTHVTLTVNRAPQPFAFSYRGVPGGALDSSDSVWLGGQSHPALDGSAAVALSGPVQSAHFTDSTRQRSLFILQFGADSLIDRYSVPDTNTAVLVLGDMLLQAPLRFSFGLVDSASQTAVESRINYVVSVTR